MSAGLTLGGLLRPRAATAASAVATAAAEFDFTSDLIYLSPQTSAGNNSRCQAEVWFVELNYDLYIVTRSNAWRARAIDTGLTKTRVWVGDEGEWQASDGAYLKLPEFMAEGAQITDAQEQARALDEMGDKYRLSWLLWGPRFKNGIADGSRVMLRYRPTA
jgi:hypothetical protein